MMPKPVIKAICFILAILMALSACAVLVTVFAADEASLVPVSVPATGDNDADYLIPAGILVAGALVIGICVALPKMKTK